MGTTDLFNWIQMYRLPPGRRAFALSEVERRARPLGFTELADMCRDALIEEAQVRDMMHQRKVERGEGADPELAPHDARIDRTIGAIFRQSVDGVDTVEDETLREHARAILSLFPTGAGGITKLGYSEQSVANDDLIAALTGPQAPAVDALGMGFLVTQLVKLQTAFNHKLAERGDSPSVSTATLRAADQQAQQRLLEIIVCALFLTRETGPDAPGSEYRAHLLAPFERQRQEVRVLYSRRAQVADVDPVEGTPVETRGADTDEAPLLDEAVLLTPVDATPEPDAPAKPL